MIQYCSTHFGSGLYLQPHTNTHSRIQAVLALQGIVGLKMTTHAEIFMITARQSSKSMENVRFLYDLNFFVETLKKCIINEQ